MPRRGNVPKREILPDPMYNSVLVTKLVNSIMLDGKKGVAQKVVYGAFDIIKDKTEKDPLEVFTQAMENIMPSLEVKARRVGGATYQVPMEVRPARRQTLGLRWLTNYSRARGERTMAERLAAVLLDADGINPQTDVNLMQVSTDACVASMENGEISAALLSDTFAYSLVQEGKLKCIRSLLDEDFADEPCCVIAMNATFVKENPTIAKKVVQCVQKAHQWMRENPEEASQVLIDEGMNSGDLEMNTMLNNSLQFGLDEDFTSTSLRTVVEKYIRLGLITATDDVDAVMEKVWTPVLDE